MQEIYGNKIGKSIMKFLREEFSMFNLIVDIISNFF